MGRSSKRKGGAYELEFVKEVIALGVPAKKVPLSGAMKEYSDDVVVGEDDHQQRVEVKYRSDAANFKRLHTWHPGPGEVLVLSASELEIYYLADWLDIVKALAVGVIHHNLDATFKDVSVQKGLLDWLGSADALALRRPRHRWLVCVRRGENP